MPSPSRYYSSTAAKTTLSSAIDSASTSLQLAAASGLPTQYPYTLILEKDTANEEIVEVTSLIGTAYQITRDIDGSGAKAHSIGALVEHGVSARDFTESRSHEIATTAHGVTGDVVGTSGAQTLTGKTLTTATLGSNLAAGGYKITGLATPTSTSDAATKGYIDTSVNSAALSASSAATSASSAATSAASALTSQTAAATSATSASNSATAAATSASSALTSATSAATSATSADSAASIAIAQASNASASATAAATSATSAANSATAAATSATSAAASATAAAVDAANAATDAFSALTSANSADADATAAATSATSAANSATAAATSATSAATSASSASTSATSAAASATTASNSAATATTSASQAATSASSAATSASSAATSASDAATSAASAATSYDNFDDRYLGPKSTPPSTDNDGDSLTSGVIYWNTADGNMYVWNATSSAWQVFTTTGDITGVTAGTGLSGGGDSGNVTLNLDTTSVYVVPSQAGNSGKYLTTDGTTSSWGTVDALPSQTSNSGKFLTTDGSTASWAVVAGSIADPSEPGAPSDGQIWIDTDGTVVGQQQTRWSKVMSAGVTTISGTDDNALTLSYTIGYEQVYRNGVLLSRGNDYTATNGTSVTLTDATITGDIIEIFASAVLALTDVYTQTQSDNKYATITTAQTLTNKTLTAPIITDAIIKGFNEDVNVVASAATGTINFDVSTASVWYYTSNASANHTLNFRYSSGTSLNTFMAVGDAITLVWLNTNGATAYYPNVIQIDGTTVSPKVPAAISAGNASAIDAYSFTIIKTASATFTVLETQTKFA